jgi:threonine synthase
MRYISTRGRAPALSFSEAVATGLATDGGLYVPETLPDLSAEFAAWEGLPYADLAFRFFSVFATDIPPAELADITRASYAQFSHPDVAPLAMLDERTAVLELFHGPTLAFKDFALQLLGNLYQRQIQLSGQPITVLGATSGDTGAAAIHGLLGRRGVNIFILYPEGGVAPLQERQMACTGAPSVHALAIRGSFDDAQAIIKSLFADLPLRARFNLSAINSINLARVLAQCVYYLAAWYQIPPSQRHDVEFVVPTGNFGNILAGWLVRRMGLPIRSLRIATNRNDILYRLFTTGVYDVRPVAASHAPSMDIQVASNFERFLHYHEAGDSARVRDIIQNFLTSGRHTFPAFERDVFTASRADDATIARLIGDVYRNFGYTVDPHTACGFAAPGDHAMRVILGTAHPAKFPQLISGCTGREPLSPILEALKERPIVKQVLPASAVAVRACIEQTLTSTQ